ncbi:MAG: Phosphoribosyl-ATP diphosphatase, partial [Petrotoga mobilis]
MLDYEQIIDKLDWEKNNGLIPVIVQDLDGDVLTLGYMNKEALNKTLETGKVHYWSTSRNKIWLKGESSNHIQTVKEILVDCDLDAVLIKVQQEGGACHEG